MGTYFDSNDYFKDSVGNVILPGDLVRMRHFETKKKRYYMYKIAGEYRESEGVKYIKFNHFENNSDGFDVSRREGDEGRCLASMVVVYRNRFYNNPKIDELKRNPNLRD